MPILPREQDVFPADLLSGMDEWQFDNCRHSNWWVLYTLSRREKELMRRLKTLDIPFYGPLIPKKTRSPNGRVRTSFVPLFPGYVFIHGQEEQRHIALTTNCVSRSITVDDSGGLVADLRQIYRLIESNTPLTMESRIQPGQLVRVISGPLLGMEGMVVERRGVDRLLVSVGFLQQGASIAIDDFQVEAI